MALSNANCLGHFLPSQHFWIAHGMALLAILICSIPSVAAEEAKKDATPFLLQPRKFPTAASSHYLAGELIQMDHVNRTGQLRPDRRNDQRTDDYDRAHLFTLISFGTLRYHGGPAELRDIPIGTHLHGQFYFDPKAGKDGKGAYNRAFLLEDDFSYHMRQQKRWQIETVNLEKYLLTVTQISTQDQKLAEKSVNYQVNPATRIWTGRSIGTLTNLAKGQSVLINITVATLKGPGRCTDIWIDDESRQLSTAQQTEVHRAYQKVHGIPGWIETVDNEKSHLTLTLFGGFDAVLTNEFKLKSRVAALVAEESLRCYDQNNDRMYCEVLDMIRVEPVPGSSGIQLLLKPENLLEGFRPRRILRVLSDKWHLDDLPWEEMLWPADNRVK